MRKLSVFNHISLDGYFVSANGDMSWAHQGSDDAEYQAFVADNASGDSEMLFGRVTYEMMAGFWPTPVAHQQMPVVANKMNNGRKAVFSRTLSKAGWNNTTLVKGDLVEEVRKMKQAGGPDMVILGSGSIVAHLAAAGLIDTYQVVVNPVALGAGRTLFEGLPEIMRLKLTGSRAFKNGKTFLTFKA
ncbi:dihydrofolate reductase family protein [Mucilaginibacter sp. L3T2-6]|uniref:dihydrofolate reductase family protein n=1 Tax=Mucilaginibacter sp. L3T2-6 TaxID=3062491 RepID=UPI0026768A41|nr:dihydrofolate reductase family protein [Mucilaginibacter sp. L3T2-6]MDO3642093.1 dihydrofolate reductase family protein [Mucilaginibacter sp. L3T2-6]MDV6214587.1 dihydrofolate reductase family protein [Mucilaginibacter sp. L3T2-6]